MKSKFTITFIFFLFIRHFSFGQTFTEQTGISLTGIYESVTSWGDYNNDGYLDILSTGGIIPNFFFTTIYKNNGNNTFSIQSFSQDMVSSRTITWGDYNNDGYLDILLTGYTGTSYVSKIYKNNGDNTFTEQSSIILPNNLYSVAWGDYNNDGYLDILMTGNYFSGVYKNNGDNTFTLQSNINLLNVTQGSVAWGDYDKDGFLDILLTGATGSFPNFIPYTKIYKNNGDNTFTEQTGINLTGIYNGSVAWGDINNDGYLDIVLTGNSSHFFNNNGNNTFTEQIGINISGAYNGSLDLGDYNNDGNLDVLITGGYYYTGIYKNNGNYSFSPETSTNLISVYNGSCAKWGDYDNDGNLDILLTGYDGQYCVSKIFKNNDTIINLPPLSPTNINFNFKTKKLSWNKSVDDHTPQSALSYNVAFGDLNNSNKFISCNSNINNGFRRIVGMGNQQLDTFCIVNRNLFYDSIYIFRVQSIDNSYKGSIFSSPYQFIVPPVYLPYLDTTIICGNSKQLDVTILNLNLTNLSYSWSPSNGLSNSNIKNPIAKPNQTTNYKVTVTNPSGFYYIDSIKITVQPLIVNTGIDISKICGDSVSLNPITNYPGDSTNLLWNWIPNNGLSSSSIKTPLAKPNITTNYILNLSSTEGCLASDTIKITINPSSLDAGTNKTITCGSSTSFTPAVSNYIGNQNLLSWSWSPSIGLNNTNTKSPIANPNHTTTYYTQFISPNGCTAQDSIIVFVNPMTINAGTDLIKTCGDSVIFSPITNYPGNSSNLTWSWSPSTGLNSTTIKTPKAKPITTTNYVVNLSSVEGCVATDTIKITVNPLTVDAGNNISLACGGNTTLVPTNTYHGLQSNLSYQWSPSSGLDTITKKSPKARPFTTTTYFLNLNSPEGCQAMDSVKVILNPLILTANNVTITCGDSTTFGATVNSNSSTINYNWSPSLGLSNNSILNPKVKPISTTTYYLTTTDSVCVATDTVTATVNKANFNLAFNAPQTLFVNPPFVVQLNNNTPNINSYNFTWNYGDNTIVNSNNPIVYHQYTYNGLYTVGLIATHKINSCQDTLITNGYIYCTGGTACNYTANILQSGPITKCQGDSVLLSCNTDTAFTYQWRNNGVLINSATNSQMYVHQNGIYSVTIYKLSNSCAITSSTIQVSFINLASPQLLSLGIVNPCTSDSMKIYTPLSYNTYLWSTGASTSYIYVKQSGIYSLIVKDINNCSANSLPDTIISTYLSPQSICIVGVDTASNKNIIIWNKPVSSVISAFKIYKETTAANIYNVLSTQPYSSLSSYIDLSSNPSTKADRYKISAVDTCGSETLISSFHKTNHLTINQGVGTNWNLIWDGYEGFSFPTYYIYRGTSTANMSNIGSIQSNLTSYTDNPGAGVFYYMIEVVNPNSCNPTKSLNSSFSNIIQTTNVGININTKDDLKFDIYPNPVTNELTIEMIGNKEKVAFNIFNSIGQTVYNGNLIEKTIVQTSSFASGVYIIKLNNGKVFEFKKIVKE